MHTLHLDEGGNGITEDIAFGKAGVRVGIRVRVRVRVRASVSVR
jgi:hypothetical protein